MSISQLISLILQILTWIALVDVDLHFSVMFVRNANAAEEETA
jgi:hypothetical protein